jgi:CBS domain-containing protein
MRCSELMKTDVECVSPETTVRAAARRMLDQEVGFLPVCDEGMRPVGTLTDRDLAIRALAADLGGDAMVEACMTREVVDCHPWDDIEQARQLMEQHRVSRIICTNRDQRIEGIISLSDIVDLDRQGGADTLHEISRREVRGNSGLSASPSGF